MLQGIDIYEMLTVSNQLFTGYDSTFMHYDSTEFEMSITDLFGNLHWEVQKGSSEGKLRYV